MALATTYATDSDLPHIRTITQTDLRAALKKGLEDYSHSWPISAPLALIFVFAGLYIVDGIYQAKMLHLIFPVCAGFALLAPVAATGFYEFSRRREYAARALVPAGRRSLWRLIPITLILFTVYLLWLLMANAVYSWSVGGAIVSTEPEFWGQIWRTAAGAKMLLAGCAVGFLFAVLIFGMSVVSIPMIMDRDVQTATAVGLSVKAALQSPLVMAQWAAFIAASLAIGSLPLLLGLAVVLPVLGHASWHLYRRVIS